MDSPAFERRVESVIKLLSFVYLHILLDMRNSGMNASDLNVNYIFVEPRALGIDAPKSCRSMNSECFGSHIRT